MSIQFKHTDQYPHWPLDERLLKFALEHGSRLLVRTSEDYESIFALKNKLHLKLGYENQIETFSSFLKDPLRVRSKTLVLKDHRDRLGGPFHLALKQLMHAQVVWIIRLRIVPGHQQLVSLVRRQER